MVYDKLNQMEGVSCQLVKGAMYAFPSIELPQGAVARARTECVEPDLFYCLEMLNKTGVVTVPGSGFGQKEGSWHFRITILPQEDQLADVLGSIAQFHARFLTEFGSPHPHQQVKQ
eukprot:GHVQ01040447.1.p1 GENE.GHVQ01040447.1~~GHVQ01040447.1.p1  ORF type:complete len:116 (+),score=13.19 GHVQ01040447.1:218-565(+)